MLAYLEHYHPGAREHSVVEVNLRALDWIAVISRTLERARCIFIDYGYTAAEWPRHSQGTLMSYRRHAANDDVLASPGERDITAHVAWTPLQDAFADMGGTSIAFSRSRGRCSMPESPISFSRSCQDVMTERSYGAECS